MSGLAFGGHFGEPLLALALLNASIDVLCRHDVAQVVDGLEIQERKKNLEQSRLAVSVSRGDFKKINRELVARGEPLVNCVPSIHAAELDWINGKPCAFPFSLVADMCDVKPAELRQRTWAQLKARKPANVRFVCKGPESLISREIIPAAVFSALPLHMRQGALETA